MSIQADLIFNDRETEYGAEFAELPRKGDTVSIIGGSYQVVEVKFYRPGRESFFLNRIYLEKLD